MAFTNNPFDSSGSLFDPFGDDTFDASNGSDPFGLGGYNLGAFNPFGGLGSSSVGTLAQGGGSLLGSLFGSLLGGGGGSGSGTNVNINSGTNQFDALLQNPYLANALTNGTAGTGAGASLDPGFLAVLLQSLGIGTSGIFGNGGSSGTTGASTESTSGGGSTSGGIGTGTGGSSGGQGPMGSSGGSSNPLFTSASLGPLLQGLLGLGNAGLGIYGALQGAGQQQFNNQGKTDTQTLLNSLISGNQGGSNALMGQILPEMLGLQQNLGPAYSNGLTQGNNALQAGFGGLSSFTTPTQTSQVPGLQGVFNQLGGLQGYGNSLLGSLAPMATGQTGPQQSAMQQALALASGSNSGQSALSNTAMSLLNGGQSPLTAASQSAAINALLNGGMTSGLSSLSNPATQLLNGQNPGAQQLLQQGLGITSQNPLLSMQQAQSIAENQSATQSNNQLNSLRQQLLDRTGVTGPAIASGSQNDLLNQLGDQAMQAQSAAGQNALLGQQQLQLGLYGQGASMANSGLQGLLQGQSLGSNTLLQQASQALQNQTGLGGLGNSGLNTYLSQLGLGGNLVGQGTQSQLGGLSALNGLLGTQNQSTSALSGLLGTTGGLTGQASNDVFNLQNLGLSQNSAMYQALNSLIGGQNSQNNNLLSGLTGTAGFGSNYAQNLLGQVPNFTSSLASLFNGGNTPQNLFNNILGNTAFSTGGVKTPGS